MNYLAVLISMIFIWMGAALDIYQHLFAMPKWFNSAPASFHLIGSQSKKTKAFWIPLTILILFSVGLSILLNWHNSFVRNCLIGATLCFTMAVTISLTWFTKQVLTFTQVKPRESLTPELYYHMKLWLYNTTARDLLQVMAVVFVTVAFVHFS